MQRIYRLERYKADFRRLGGLLLRASGEGSPESVVGSPAFNLDNDTQRQLRKQTFLALLRRYLNDEVVRDRSGDLEGFEGDSVAARCRQVASEVKVTIVVAIRRLWSVHDADHDGFEDLVDADAQTIDMTLSEFVRFDAMNFTPLPGNASVLVSHGVTQNHPAASSIDRQHQQIASPFVVRDLASIVSSCQAAPTAGSTLPSSERVISAKKDTARLAASSAADRDSVVEEVRRSIQQIRQAAARVHENIGSDAEFIDSSGAKLAAAVVKTQSQTKTVDSVVGGASSSGALRGVPLLSKVPGLEAVFEYVLLPLWTVVKQVVTILFIVAVTVATMSVVIYVPRAYVRREYIGGAATAS